MKLLVNCQPNWLALETCKHQENKLLNKNSFLHFLSKDQGRRPTESHQACRGIYFFTVVLCCTIHLHIQLKFGRAVGRVKVGPTVWTDHFIKHSCNCSCSSKVEFSCHLLNRLKLNRFGREGAGGQRGGLQSGGEDREVAALRRWGKAGHSPHIHTHVHQHTHPQHHVFSPSLAVEVGESVFNC